jgi:hypothetical protein
MMKLLLSVYPYKIWRAHSDHGFSARHAKSTLFDPPWRVHGERDGTRTRRSDSVISRYHYHYDGVIKSRVIG